MTTVTIKGYVYVERTERWFDAADGKYLAEPVQELRAGIYASPNMDQSVFGVRVGPIEVTHELPADFDYDMQYLRAKLDTLTKERAEAAEEFAKTVRRIDAEIAKLTAIGMEA